MPDNGRKQAVVERQTLARLIPVLESRGYQVIGPLLRDGAILYDTVHSLDELPAGWTDEQEAGKYRVKRRADDALFGYTVGPHSWKQFLHPAEVRLFTARREGDLFHILPERAPPPRYAFLGVRACELAAIAVQDRVLAGDGDPDPVYQGRRRDNFFVAVQCTQSAPTCFCVSMNTGPRARQGFDLALTELLEDGRHLFLAEAGSEAGAAVLAELDPGEASAALREKGEQAEARAARQTRHLDTAGIRDLLYANFEHPRWDQVAGRCLTCGNCTMVCPTCFCTSVENTSDLTGEQAEQWRRWDSCFSQSFTYIHGGSVRASAKSRYRQWMTHKLASWIDQFGSSGCVGCGRCITWCPVGIDLTEEAAAIRESPLPDAHGNTGTFSV